jgi:hypothetical protein
MMPVMQHPHDSALVPGVAQSQGKQTRLHLLGTNGRHVEEDDKEDKSSVNRDLSQCQKRPSTVSKETCRRCGGR